MLPLKFLVSSSIKPWAETTAGRKNGVGTASLGKPSFPQLCPFTRHLFFFEFSSWKDKGRFMFGPYLKDNPNAGYRLSYSPGGTYQLLRITRRGASIIETVEGGAKLEDRRKHQIQWTRTHDGGTKVSVDGQQIMDVQDRGFRRAVAGFQM